MLTLILHLVKVTKEVVNFFSLHIVFAKLVLEYHERLLKILNARVKVSRLEADQTKCQVALSCDNVIRSKLILKEVFNFWNVLNGLVIVVLVYRLVCNSSEQISLCYVFFPNLNNFGEERSGFLNWFFVSEKLTHVIVRTTEVETLRAVLFAFQEDTIRQFFKGFLVSFRFGLGQK